MKRDSVVTIIEALNDAQVHYLIVGGLAVVAHGYVRFTADVDLLLSTEPDNLKRTVAALKDLGYRPRAPVKFDDFVDPATRREWAEEKNMTVFSLFSDTHQATEIDLFLESPIDFSAAYARAVRQEVTAGTAATFCSLEDLIELKELAGRPEDKEDIQKLMELKKRRDEGA
jgi:predicted nucleotidyltransferase